MDDRPILLAIQHIPWETPHRILDACDGLAVHTVNPWPASRCRATARWPAPWRWAAR